MTGRIAIVVGALLGAAAPAAADTLIVRPDGSGDFPTIQAAVDAAVDGDEILLADGTFRGPGNRNIAISGKSLTIRPESGWPGAAILDCESPTFPDAAHAAFRIRSGAGATRIEGITIEDALIGVDVQDASPTLQDVTVRAGWSPALVFHRSSPLIRGCVVESNTRANTRLQPAHPGALALVSGDAVVEDCTIRGNAGSGIVVWDASPVLLDCTISGNRGSHGGGIDIRGLSSPAVRTCAVVGNRAYYRGGGIHASLATGSALTVEGCTFSGNTTYPTYSGGMGGGAYISGSGQVTFSECTFTGNYARSMGGGLRLDPHQPVALVRCTIAGNRTTLGGGVAVNSGTATVLLEGTILWDNCALNAPAMYVGHLATVAVVCSDVDTSGVYAVPAATLTYQDTITVDPQFCLPAACSGAPISDGVYTVASASPALAQPCGPMGALGADCGIAVERLSWAAIKAQYRDAR